MSAIKSLQLAAPDAIILDLQLPDVDGVEICRRVRATGDMTPVLMVTARDAVDDRVAGLDAGADDYLVKPFDLAELFARLRALLRRRGPLEGEGDILRFEDLSLDLSTRDAKRGDREFTLTRVEFDLLELFLRHPRQVLTRELILDRVWGYDFDTGTNSLAVYVGYLRRKLEEEGEPRLLQTVRGVGYVLKET
jgi:two-component system response regulator MprA